MLVRIANMEDPDRTAFSDLGLPVCLSFCGRQLLFKILEHLL